MERRPQISAHLSLDVALSLSLERTISFKSIHDCDVQRRHVLSIGQSDLMMKRYRRLCDHEPAIWTSLVLIIFCLAADVGGGKDLTARRTPSTASSYQTEIATISPTTLNQIPNPQYHPQPPKLLQHQRQ